MGATLLVALLLSTGAHGAGDVPLPPLRPNDLEPARRETPGRIPDIPAPPSAQPPPPQPAPDPAEAAVCTALLSSGKIVGTQAAAVTGPGGCGIAAPVQVAAVLLPAGSRVTLEPAPTLRCDFAERVADWVRDDLAPILDRGPRRLVRLAVADGYDCRGRNRVPDARLSEHAIGNAIDLRALAFSDGATADITAVPAAIPLFAQIKLTACARFATVLGPGSDGYHEDNLHLDAARRHTGAHFCRWALP